MHPYFGARQNFLYKTAFLSEKPKLCQMSRRIFRYGVLSVLMLSFATQMRSERYLCEIGPIAGFAYYVGDATPTVFQHWRPVYGAVFRYKFDSRWSLALKGQHGDIEYELADELYRNELTTLDVSGEFNFFRMERNAYKRDCKNYSPYLNVGVGVGLSGTQNTTLGAYLPVGFGFKWNIVPLINLQIEWQHQFYLTDRLEGNDYLANSYKLNGTNFLRNDMFSTITFGITVNLWKEREVCRCAMYPYDLERKNRQKQTARPCGHYYGWQRTMGSGAWL